MRFSTYINNQRCLEWGLNANQGALFDLINQSASWAKEMVIDGVVYYWVSRNTVIEELPLFYSKPDTVYRHFVELNKKGLIKYLKHGDKDLIRLTEKGKAWNEFSSDLNPTLGNKSEPTRISIRKSSDLNPTNNNTNYKNTSDQNNNTPDPLDLAFEAFWSAGLPKVAKPKAMQKFKLAYQAWTKSEPDGDRSPQAFAQMLVSDIRQRLGLNQFGFAQLHPTTYLNNQRWKDDYPPSEPPKSAPQGFQSFSEMNRAGNWNTPEAWENVW